MTIMMTNGLSAMISAHVPTSWEGHFEVGLICHAIFVSEAKRGSRRLPARSLRENKVQQQV